MSPEFLSPSQLPICVIVLVGSQSGKLPGCLERLTFASSIILADNNSGYDFSQFSSDKRIKLMHRDAPITDFANIRQELMMLADQPWVLFVDQDEQVTGFDSTELSKQLEDEQLKGLSVVRSDIFYGKRLQYGEAGSQRLIRLVRPEFCQWIHAVHEVAVVEGQTGISPITIDHFAHDSVADFVDDVSRYARLVAQSRVSTPIRNLLELIVYPPTKLLYGLIVQGGALDGWRGVVYALVMSLHSLLVRLYWYEQHQPLAHTA